MDYWAYACYVLSEIFEKNQHLNFGIRLTPDEVSKYLEEKTLHFRVDSPTINAALFVTNDGECGFISSKMTPRIHRTLTKEFKDFVLHLPEELRGKLWCRVQKNNTSVIGYVKRIGFEVDSESDTALYFLYKGG